MRIRLVASICVAVSALSISASAQSGSQVIRGTKVFTEVFKDRGYARFSNACGSQTLTQRQLQGGAIPTDIIPCPRPVQSADGHEPDDEPDDVPQPVARPSYGRSAAEQAALDAEMNASGRVLPEKVDHQIQGISPGPNARAYDGCALRWNQQGYGSKTNYKTMVAAKQRLQAGDTFIFYDCFSSNERATQEQATRAAFDLCKNDRYHVNECFLFATGNKMVAWAQAESDKITDGSRERAWQANDDRDQAEAAAARNRAARSNNSNSGFIQGLGAAAGAAAGAYGAARGSGGGTVNPGVSSCPAGTYRVINGYGAAATCAPYAQGSRPVPGAPNSDISGTR